MGRVEEVSRFNRYQQSFEDPLHRSRSSHTSKLNSTTTTKKIPNFATPTYSSLKMFNQGSPTTSFKNQNSRRNSEAFQAYMKNRTLNEVITNSNEKRHEHKKAPSLVDSNNDTDDVSEISSDEESPKQTKNVENFNNRQQNFVSTKTNLSTSPTQEVTRVNTSDKSRGITTKSTGSVARTKPSDSAVFMGRSQNVKGAMVSSQAKSKTKMDKAQMRLLFGVIDDQGKTADGAKTSARKNQVTPKAQWQKKKNGRKQRPPAQFKV